MVESLSTLAAESKNILGRVSTIPLIFWRKDSITVEKTKVTVSSYNLIGEEEVYPMSFTDLIAANYSSNPLLATVYFQIKNDYNKPSSRKVTHLPVEEARKITELITGLIIAHKEHAEINATQNTRKIANQLQELGTAEAAV